MRAKLNVDFEYLKNVFFDHRYFSVTDSNNVTLAYSNDSVSGARLNCDNYVDLYPNTLTIYSPQSNTVNKYEFPDVTLKGLEFHCGIPHNTKGTLMCDLDLEFMAKSNLMNGDIHAIVNDHIPITYNALDELTIQIDPASGEILLDFDNVSCYDDDNYNYSHHHHGYGFHDYYDTYDHNYAHGGYCVTSTYC